MRSRGALRIRLLFPGDRVAERPGRALLDHRDDLLHVCRVRVDPGPAVVVEDLRQPSDAVLHVRASPMVVMDGDPLANVVHLVVEMAVTRVAGIEAYYAVGAVAGRFVGGGATTAKCNRGTGSTRRFFSRRHQALDPWQVEGLVEKWSVPYRPDLRSPVCTGSAPGAMLGTTPSRQCCQSAPVPCESIVRSGHFA